jgi:uncharacterized membrane protein
MKSVNLRSLIYKPFNLLYLVFLIFLLITVAGWFLSFFEGLLVEHLGLPQRYFWSITLLSLIGSYVNLPFALLESKRPVPYVEKVESFGITYEIPKVDISRKQTLVLINLGGAVIPTIISLYMLYSIYKLSPNPLLTVAKTLIVLVIVTLNTYQSAQIVEGLGITTPAWGPPTMTAFVVFLINYFSPVNYPMQIAYIGGTLGALIGADLLNLGKVAGIGPVVSIGGAGTFDGVYLTGLMSVLLILIIS